MVLHYLSQYQQLPLVFPVSLVGTGALYASVTKMVFSAAFPNIRPRTALEVALPVIMWITVLPACTTMLARKLIYV